jgi:hypothetical protein
VGIVNGAVWERRKEKEFYHYSLLETCSHSIFLNEMDRIYDDDDDDYGTLPPLD